MATSPRLVCDEIAEIFERHVAGTATAAEAAQLAGHALECERCSIAMRKVEEFEPKFGPPPASPKPPARFRVWRAGHPLLIALASVGVIALAGGMLWRTATRPRVPQPIMRGRGGTLALLATWQDDGALRVIWARSPKTLVYHVQLTGSTGAELLKSATQPQLTLSAAEVATLGEITVTVDAEAASGERTSKSSTLRTVQRAAPE